MTLMLRWFEEAGYATDVVAPTEEHPWLLTLEEFLRESGWQAVPDLLKFQATIVGPKRTFAQGCAVSDFSF